MRKLQLLSHLTRRRCELFARKCSHRRFFDMDDLGGMCGAASLVLGEVLLRHNIKHSFVHEDDEGAAHCWLKRGRFHIDITGSQFGGEPVHIDVEPVPSCLDGDIKIVRGDTRRRLNYLLKWGWPKNNILSVSEINRIAESVCRKYEKTVDAETKKPRVVYFEPLVVISPFRLPNVD